MSNEPKKLEKSTHHLRFSSKFHKQIQLFMLISKKLILLKLVKISRSYGPYKMTTFCGQ